MGSTKREKFEEKLTEIVAHKSENTKMLTEEQYQSIVNDLKEIEKGQARTSVQYYRKSHYRLKIVNGVEKIVARDKDLYYVSNNELYDVINEAHLNTGHGGRNILENELGKSYYNVTRNSVTAYLSVCEECQLKRNKVRKSVVVKPIVSNDMNSRAQVDLIDMQSQPDASFRFIMVYQDHLTKFVQLKALKTKRAEEVAHHLVDIFCSFGAPHILQSDNGREFANKLIVAVLSLWPECRMVHGKPRHSQSQGSVERANRDIQDKLVCWMRDNQTTKWSEGLRFVQFQKNRSFHSGIGRCPYQAMFGFPPKVCLSTSNLPREVIPTLLTEEDLEIIFDPENASDQAENALSDTNGDTRSKINDKKKHKSTDCDDEKRCVSCQNSTSGAHICQICQNFCHAIEPCGFQLDSDNEGFGFEVLCRLCQQAEKTDCQRKAAKRKQIEQADKMKALSNKRFKEAAVGDSVLVPVPEVDRGRVDPRNVMAVVTAVQDGFYQLATESGTLKQSYARNQFEPCREKFLSIDKIPVEKQISLREAATASSLGSGQGFFKCQCTQKCQTRKCKCIIAGVKCNSKCHASSSCCNK